MEMCIDAQATIGPGLYIGHIGGVHINPQAVLGRNCDLAHRVTIGTSAMGREGAPVLGDDVYIGTGATLVGKIKIGNGAKIAANTLVISNVPAGATVMGVPGRIVMRAPESAAAGGAAERARCRVTRNGRSCDAASGRRRQAGCGGGGRVCAAAAGGFEQAGGWHVLRYGVCRNWRRAAWSNWGRDG